IVVESSDGKKIRLGWWGARWPASSGKWYLYFHVEIPESDRKINKKTGAKDYWASSEKVPPPFCSWPKELQMSVAQWILSIAGPEDLISQLSVREVNLRHRFLSGFYIHLNVPEGVEL